MAELPEAAKREQRLTLRKADNYGAFITDTYIVKDLGELIELVSNWMEPDTQEPF